MEHRAPPVPKAVANPEQPLRNRVSSVAREGGLRLGPALVDTVSWRFVSRQCQQ